MTATQAHNMIRAHYGRGSAQDLTACRFLAYGRFDAVRALAAKIPAATV